MVDFEKAFSNFIDVTNTKMRKPRCSIWRDYRSKPDGKPLAVIRHRHSRSFDGITFTFTEENQKCTFR